MSWLSSAVDHLFGNDTPDAPSAPTTGQAVADWAKYLPQIYQTQMEYAPQEMQQQLDLYNQYAPQFTQAQYDISKGLYPETVGLQEQLARQASQGMQEGMPQEYQDKYSDYFKSQLGTNVGSNIGADYYSRGMLEQQKSWQDYYRNLGLSVTGRQPLQQNAMGQSTNYMGGFTPMGVGAQQQQGYSTAAGIYGNQLANQSNPFMNLVGGLGGAAVGGMFGYGGSMAQPLI